MDLALTTRDAALLLAVARGAIEAHLAQAENRLPADLPEALMQPGSAFVTLHLESRLRGCIGDLEARHPLAESVRRNAVNAAVADPRFPPLTPAELPQVELEITCLAPARAATSIAEIELGTHGIIMHKQGRRAVFLPQVAADQGWDLQTTLEHLARKAGFPRDGWREGATFEIFEGLLISE